MVLEFGLIGRTLKHSFSERYFNAHFGHCERPRYSYTLFELPEIEALPAFLEAHPNLRGFNVTNPYKQSIIPYLDRLDDTARWIGAVNCVKREHDRWVGYNTDYLGVADSLQHFLCNERPAQALILGTGGASQAVQYVLREMKIPYALVSRTPGRGEYTYQDLPQKVVIGAKLIINATPLGTYPAVEEAPELPYECLTSDHYLFDLVYNPPFTEFLRRGAASDAHTMSGDLMLRSQAEASWSIWQIVNTAPPMAVTRNA